MAPSIDAIQVRTLKPSLPHRLQVLGTPVAPRLIFLLDSSVCPPFFHLRDGTGLTSVCGRSLLSGSITPTPLIGGLYAVFLVRTQPPSSGGECLSPIRRATRCAKASMISVLIQSLPGHRCPRSFLGRPSSTPPMAKPCP